MLKVLVACEYSGAVRDAFTRKGHFAMSCDLLPSEVPGIHWQGDVREILGMGWDLMIAHPPCTHLAVSGAKHFAAKRERVVYSKRRLISSRFSSMHQLIELRWRIL